MGLKYFKYHHPVLKIFCDFIIAEYNESAGTNAMRRNRSKDILAYFEQNAGSAVTLLELSERFGVSSRQIKNYIRQINEESGQERILSDQGSYRLNESLTPVTEVRDFSPEERVSILISSLLFEEKPIDAYDLAEELFVSDATLESDLKKLRRRLSPFRLTLKNEGGNLSILGSERDKRSFASYMITNTSYKGFMFDDADRFLDNGYQIDLIKENLIRIFMECSFYYNDYSLNNIILHLIITIDRLRNHYYVEESSIGLEISEIERSATEKIAAFLEEAFQIEVVPSEKSNIAAFLASNLATLDYRVINRENVSSYISESTIELVDYMLEKVTDYYLLDPFDDVFFSRFCLHVDNLIKRQKISHSIHNPMIMDIKRTYPLIFDIAVYCASLIEEKTGYRINQDEISLIALHIGSFIESLDSNRNKVSAIYVYSDYHQFYQHNITVLQNRFSKELNLMYTISIHDFDRERMKPDFVISETPLPGAVIVAPFITDEQMELISNRIRRLSVTKESDRFVESLCELTTENLFFTDLYGEDEFDVIRQLTDRLSGQGYFDDSFVESVISRERLSSTCFVKKVAIPHAIGHSVSRSFISFVTYEKKQNWGGEGITLLILFGISYVDRKDFRFVFNHLVKLLNKEANINLFSNCRTYQEFMNVLSQLARE